MKHVENSEMNSSRVDSMIPAEKAPEQKAYRAWV